MNFLGRKISDKCTTEFKSSLGSQIAEKAKRYEKGMATIRKTNRPASEVLAELDETRKIGESLIEKYIKECGTIEIGGRRYTDPRSAFSAQREEVRRGGLTIPDEEEGEW